MSSPFSDFLDRMSITLGNIALLAVFPVAMLALATLH